MLNNTVGEQIQGITETFGGEDKLVLGVLNNEMHVTPYSLSPLRQKNAYKNKPLILPFSFRYVLFV